MATAPAAFGKNVDFVLKSLDFALKCLDFILKMFDFCNENVEHVEHL